MLRHDHRSASRRALRDSLIGDDVHAIGPIPTLKSIGAIVIKPDGTRVLAQVTPDPLTGSESES